MVCISLKPAICSFPACAFPGACNGVFLNSVDYTVGIPDHPWSSGGDHPNGIG